MPAPEPLRSKPLQTDPLRQDQLSIDTPELVALEFPLAGIGSRMIAVLVDYLLQSLFFTVLIVGSMLFLPSLERFQAIGSKWIVALLILIPFLLHWGYFALFEGLWRGQTPGKRAAKIRVIQQSGRSVTMFESLARNLVRAIDMLPVFYASGVVSIFVTARNQRLGDLVAGTLVVHEGQTPESASAGATRLFTQSLFAPTSPQAMAVRSVTLPADALARLGPQDLEAIEVFLERRLDMTAEVRQGFAARLAAAAAARMEYAPSSNMSQENFLEEIAYGMRSLGTRR